MRKVQPPPGSSALCEPLPPSLTGAGKRIQRASAWMLVRDNLRRQVCSRTVDGCRERVGE